MTSRASPGTYTLNFLLGSKSTLKTLTELAQSRKQRDRSSIYKSRQKPSNNRKSDLIAKSGENYTVEAKANQEALTPEKPKRMGNYDDSMSRKKSIAHLVDSILPQSQNQNMPTTSKLKPKSSSSSSFSLSMIQEKPKIFH